MLQVDAQGIETLTGHDLGRETVGHGEPAKRHVFAVAPHLFDLVPSHYHISSVAAPAAKPLVRRMAIECLTRRHLNVAFLRDVVEPKASGGSQQRSRHLTQSARHPRGAWRMICSGARSG